MKKLLLLAAIAVFGLSNVNAQAQLGLTAGFLSASATAEAGGASITASESGIYFGGVADFEMSDELHIQAEVLYASIKDASMILAPIMAKYYVAEGFNIQAGPQLGYSLEDTGDDVTALWLGLGAGVGYDINENFSVEARYAIQLNDSYTGDHDYSLKMNTLNAGVVYKFD